MNTVKEIEKIFTQLQEAEAECGGWGAAFFLVSVMEAEGI